MGKRESKKQELRAKIIEAARLLFMEQGYEATSIEQIAEKAEVGLGTAYNYFKSKEELYVLSMTGNMTADFSYLYMEDMEFDQACGRIRESVLFIFGHSIILAS